MMPLQLRSLNYEQLRMLDDIRNLETSDIPFISVNNCLRRVTNKQISCVRDFCTVLKDLGNAVFNEVRYLLEMDLTNAPDHWSLVEYGKRRDLLRLMSRCGHRCLFQFVWVKCGSVHVLSRDYKWYDTVSECRNIGLNNRVYGCVLLAESCCPCNIPITEFDSGEYACKCLQTNDISNETLTMDGFTGRRVNNVTILRAPWYITSTNQCGATYNFKIDHEDEWFESEKFAICDAYLEYVADK